MKKLTLGALIAASAIAITAYAFLAWQKAKLPPPKQAAQLLLERAGGTAEVCREANQMFKRFGVDKITFLGSDDLKSYPAVSALGKVDGIWPGSPAYIKIRIGTHRDGYLISILDTNSAVSYEKGPNEVEIVGGCVYAHR